MLAHAGVASRRASESLIQAGRVSVNGKVVTELGTKVDPRRDKIRVDGKPLPRQSEPLTYIILNKPRNLLSAASDDRGRKTVLDLVDVEARLYPVGRLDLQSEGLILLTNDAGILFPSLAGAASAPDPLGDLLIVAQQERQTRHPISKEDIIYIKPDLLDQMNNASRSALGLFCVIPTRREKGGEIVWAKEGIDLD